MLGADTGTAAATATRGRRSRARTPARLVSAGAEAIQVLAWSTRACESRILRGGPATARDRTWQVFWRNGCASIGDSAQSGTSDFWWITTWRATGGIGSMLPESGTTQGVRNACLIRSSRRMIMIHKGEYIKHWVEELREVEGLRVCFSAGRWVWERRRRL